MDIRDAFFGELYKAAQTDKNIIILTCDMGAYALEDFKKEYPSQYYNIGIMEQSSINVAAGLTLMGFKVFVYGIAAFMIYRCLEQIKLNLSDMELPITIIGSGPGLSYKADGPTHHAIYDIPIMRSIPHIMIITPTNADEAMEAAQIALKTQKAIYIRLGKSSYPHKYGGYIDNYYEQPFIQTHLGDY